MARSRETWKPTNFPILEGAPVPLGKEHLRFGEVDWAAKSSRTRFTERHHLYRPAKCHQQRRHVKRTEPQRANSPSRHLPLEERISMTIRNRKGERGSPYLTLLLD